MPLLSLDAVGTLVFPYPSVGHVYSHYLDQYGLASDPVVLNHRFKQAYAQATATPRQHVNEVAERSFWRVVVQDTLGPAYNERRFESIWQGFGQGKHWRLAAGLPAALSLARSKGYSLALLSNADSRFHRVLNDLGIASYFSYIFLSTECGYEKPDPRIFEYVEKQTGFAPEDIHHMGDDEEKDLNGAQSAAWHSYLVEEGELLPAILRLPDVDLA